MEAPVLVAPVLADGRDRPCGEAGSHGSKLAPFISKVHSLTLHFHDLSTILRPPIPLLDLLKNISVIYSNLPLSMAVLSAVSVKDSQL